MNILSTKTAQEVRGTVSSFDNHHVVIRAYSENKPASEFEAELTAQEMARVLDFISNLQKKGYTID